MPPGFECDCRSRYLRPFHLGRALSDPMLWLASAAFSISPKSLPNGDSIEPRDSSSELAAYGDPQPPWTLNTRTSTAFSLLGPFFHCPPEIQKSRGRPSRTRSFACHERRAYPRTNRATAKHPMKVMRDVPILTLSGLAGLLVGMALYRFHVPFLILVGISIAPIVVWAAYETSKMFD